MPVIIVEDSFIQTLKTLWHIRVCAFFKIRWIKYKVNLKVIILTKVWLNNVRHVITISLKLFVQLKKLMGSHVNGICFFLARNHTTWITLIEKAPKIITRCQLFYSHPNFNWCSIFCENYATIIQTNSYLMAICVSMWSGWCVWTKNSRKHSFSIFPSK